MLRLILLVISGLCITDITGQSPVKFSSSCSVPICGSSSGGAGGNCTGSTPCYTFKSPNETLCAPQVQCSLFDLCTSGTRCTTNTSICIINSCCSQAICMPRALASACVASNSSGSSNPSPYVTPTPPTTGVATDTAPLPIPPLSATIRLCNNATWDPNYSILSGINGSFGSNETMLWNPVDLFIDNNNTIYVADSGNHRIQKFITGSAIGTTVARTSPFQSNAIYVDGAGTIYSCEEAYSYMPLGRLQKYSQGNIYGTTLLGGVGKCGIAVTQLCGCAGIYADRQGLLYISDRPNGRVLLYNTTAGSVTLLAGIYSIPGNQADQLSSPGSIYMDENQTLFVADMGNQRVQKFIPGNTTGVTIVSSGFNYFYYFYYVRSMVSDSLGSLYFSGQSIARWTPAATNISIVVDGSIINSYAYSTFVALRFDTNGSLCTIAYNMLIKFKLLSNIC